MKFSVIIPCFNVEKYIRKTLESIEEQTYKDIEVILIDDGSTDNTLSILQEYSKKDNRFRVFFQENRGVSESRNRGLELTNGDYIYFLDGDDVIEPRLFEFARKIFLKEKVEMLAFGYDLIDGDKLKEYFNKKYDKNFFSSKDFLKMYLKLDIRYNICSFIAHEKVIKKLKFNKELIIGEDVDYQLRVLLEKDFNIFYVKDIYFHYLKRNNSATTTEIFNFKEIFELEYLDSLRGVMLSKGIEEYKYYQIVNFFYFFQRISKKKISEEDYIVIKYELSKYSYILKDLKIEFDKKSIGLFLLKIAYSINFKLVIFLLDKF